MDMLSVNPESIHWKNQQSYLFLNPKLSTEQKQKYISLASSFHEDASLYLSSSGTTTSSDEVVLKVIKKNNFLEAAKNFNSFFAISSKDRWLKNLPRFHVGGLSILARAFLSGSSVHEWPDLYWNVEKFCSDLIEKEITRVSLVPTQVYDLVQREMLAPTNLKSVFVGGAALDVFLYQKARKLGWPLLPSYGMTETSSMVMSAPLDTLSASRNYEGAIDALSRDEKLPGMKTLPGVRIHWDQEGRAGIQAPGLLSSELRQTGNQNTQKSWNEEDVFWTQDYLIEENGEVFFKARSQDLIKVSGELVNLEKLRSHFKTLCSGFDERNFFLHHRPNPRKGSEIILYVADHVKKEHVLDDGRGLTFELEDKFAAFIENFNKTVLPFEKICDTVEVPEIPRTSMGKVKISELILSEKK